VARRRAVILAAGRGVRMGGRSPKSLVAVGEHEPLMHYLLRGLEAAGAADLLVVTGFGADPVAAFVRARWSGDATFAFNARWASWGNFHSVRVALDQSPGAEVIVVNSDVVVHPEVFRRVIDAEGDLVLAVQPRERLEAEDMRVLLDGDLVRAIGKDLAPGAHGEFCGVSAIRPSAARAYLEAATEAEWRADTGIYYEDVYARILPRVEARAAAVGLGEYAEVDEPADLRAAADVIARHSDAWAAAPERA
jgi:choline kinase